ncbi:MAG: nucleoside hydrolase [Eubacteriales bacterium]|nr:nucleoside hydrolase [Eubacteriales bacterium]
MNYHFTVPDYKKVRVILDSDTANEADDPFAIVHALLSPKMMVKGIVAEHYGEENSMEASYEAIQKLVAVMKNDTPVFRGEEFPFSEEKASSEGVQFMIEEARKEEKYPLYILCMGALTNVARALQTAPDIAEKVTVVTIGGRPYTDCSDAFDDNFREYNFGNDVAAANTVLMSKAEIWQIPANVYSMVRIGIADLQLRLEACKETGKYLLRQLDEFNQTERAFWTTGESWSLGDSPSVTVVLDPTSGYYHVRQAYMVNEDTSYAEAIEGKKIRVYDYIDKHYLLSDFFAKLTLFERR